ncbi:MAG: hypothetical protein HKN92_00565 [Chitinophagales bacterium]|nr:hypothetical protein [Chitinophagales bacterium]
MKRSIIIILSTLFIFAACDRPDSPLGPNVEEVFGEFEILTPLSSDKETVDFSNDETVIFNAEWTTLEDWTLTITGKKSGAVKTLRDYSTGIDAENGEWIGETTFLPIFRKEICYVELRFDNESPIFYDTITISEVKVNNGVLITDFENGVDPLWPHFYQSGVNFFDNKSRPAGQGSTFLDASGTVPWDFLIGLIEFPALLTTGDTTFPLTSNSANVFFNVMVFGDINKSNSFFIFRFYEDENGDGEWDPDTEDMWVTAEQFTLFTGWKLFSFNYDTDLLVSGKGNGIPESDKILSVEYLLLSDPDLGETRGDLDYLIFTENKPLQP